MLASELAARLSSAAARETFSVLQGTPWLEVRLDSRVALPALPCPVLSVAEPSGDLPDYIDVALPDRRQLREIGARIEAHPQAAAVLVQVLRHNARAAIGDGLLVESLAYSALQGGAEFSRWLAGRQRRAHAPAAGPAVDLARNGASLTITLNRPGKRNAYSAAMRDGLCEALQLVADDASIEQVVLRGAGSCFSAGGDLDEFGTLPDPATAHLVRTTRSAAALLHAVAERVECRLHGACVGAGIELPSFAARVVASRDAFFMLPEVAMGLIPGARGTVGITRRIGRRRCALMALSGERIDPPTALDWGLIDAIE